VFVEMSHAALYFLLVSFIAALVGQHFLRKILKLFGRASIIIFILASIIFISAILLGISIFLFESFDARVIFVFYIVSACKLNL
jgi:hypothetical protein